MTNQELRERVVEKIVDGISITFGNDMISDKVSIFGFAETNEDTAKQKASIDTMVKILTEDGYEITLCDIDVSQENGVRKYKHSVILRSRKNETNI